MPQSVLPPGSEFGNSVGSSASTGFDTTSGSAVDLDLDLGQLDTSAPPPPPRAPERTQPITPEPDLPSLGGMNFDLPSPTPPAPAPANSGPMDFDLSSISLDLGGKTDETTQPVPNLANSPGGPTTDFGDIDLASAGGGDADPIARKLELAEEFRQIGDMEGARDLLQEVVAKASGSVKARAQAMLNELG